jgi:hypothetical protein
VQNRRAACDELCTPGAGRRTIFFPPLEGLRKHTGHPDSEIERSPSAFCPESGTCCRNFYGPLDYENRPLDHDTLGRLSVRSRSQHEIYRCNFISYNDISIYNSLNGRFAILDQKKLTEILKDDLISDFASGCWHALTKLLEAKVRSANWAGSIIAAKEFPTNQIVSNPNLQKTITAYQALRLLSFETTRAFIEAELADKTRGLSPANFLARVGQPQTNAEEALRVAQLFSSAPSKQLLDKYTCDSNLLAVRWSSKSFTIPPLKHSLSILKSSAHLRRSPRSVQ